MISLKIILIAILIVIGIGIVGFFTTEEVQTNPEICNIYQETDKDNINLMFFGQKDQVEEQVNKLFAITPFNEYKDKFNIYYIDEYPYSCGIHSDPEGNIKVMLCYSEEINELSKNCPHDYRVYIYSYDTKKGYAYTTTASYYPMFISLNLKNDVGSTLAHEMGHLAGLLTDEYEVGMYCRIKGVYGHQVEVCRKPTKEPIFTYRNCRKECNWEVNDGCFKGCSNQDYYRSIENGIMRNPKSNYFGKYNEKAIREVLDNQLYRKKSITGQIIYELTPRDKIMFID